MAGRRLSMKEEAEASAIAEAEAHSRARLLRLTQQAEAKAQAATHATVKRLEAQWASAERAAERRGRLAAERAVSDVRNNTMFWQLVSRTAPVHNAQTCPIPVCLGRWRHYSQLTNYM